MKIAIRIKKDLKNFFCKIKKKKLHLHEPYFFGNEKKYLNVCINRNAVASEGNFHIKFENAIKKFTGAKYCVLFCNGTAALHVGLQVLGVEDDDEVLIPNINYIASSNAALYLNAVPNFVSIDEKSLGINVVKLKNFLEKNTIIKKKKLYNIQTKRFIKAIIPLHLFGYPCQIDKIVKLAKIYKLKVLEDAAEGFGTFFKKKHIGTFGNAGVLSFNGNKIITSAGGGALITNNKKLALEAKKLANVSKINHPWKMSFSAKGYNYRMPNLNAALGLAQIENIKKVLKYKKVIYRNYKKIFFKNKYFSLYKGIKNSNPNHWLITIILNKKYIKYRDYIIKFLISININVRPVWDPMTRISYLKKYPSMKPDNSIAVAQKIINLPSSAYLYKFFK